ncbi:MAG: exodeoxyribonuclease VII large subunit [Alphaproteobacteria bacterium]|nr:exodeoxyribonuclease VII large subunit [Alphaproteobacteria bacterium]
MLQSSNLFENNDKIQEFSVSALSNLLKQTLETRFANVLVRGEISGLKIHSSGHAYFALKDDTAVLDGICWRGTVSKLSIRPADGMDVIAKGKITTYPGRSKYQIIIESMELAGQGALLQILEERKKALAAEGLFASDRKKPIPYLPECIGVVTSETGAVIRDILHRIEDRFPSHILLWSVAVQGQGAAEQIAAAIDGFNRLAQKPQLLIVARGGGSLEDLWAFNEEIVVRAVAASQIPIISAVGHETDTTLIDYAADKRAPTPTAAAEMAVPVRLDLLTHTEDRQSRLLSSIHRFFAERRSMITSVQRGLPNLGYRLGELSQRLDDWQDRLQQSLISFSILQRSILQQMTHRLKHPRDILEQNKLLLDSQWSRAHQAITFLQGNNAQSLQTMSLLLNSYSFHSTLKRGFSMITKDDGAPVTSKSHVHPQQKLNIIFHDGDVGVSVD